MHDHDKFRQEAEAAGFEVFHYNGRWFWSGPAVQVLRQDYGNLPFSIPLQRDDMGRDHYVVYPRARRTDN